MYACNIVFHFEMLHVYYLFSHNSIRKQFAESIVLQPITSPGRQYIDSCTCCQFIAFHFNKDNYELIRVENYFNN